MTVGVDGSVLERIAKIMTYLRLGSSGKVHLVRAMSCSSEICLGLDTEPNRPLADFEEEKEGQD